MVVVAVRRSEIAELFVDVERGASSTRRLDEFWVTEKEESEPTEELEEIIVWAEESIEFIKNF